MKVALVCDWLTETGGAEKVILALHEMYPQAPIYTSQYRPKRATWFYAANVKTGWLNWLPVRLRRLVPFLRQWYFSRLDLSNYDLVISITGAEAKAVKTGDNTLHISYMHAPTQYYWTLYDDYLKNPGFGVLNPIVRFGLKLLIKPLRKADYKSAQQPDVIVANSSYIQSEIKKYYKRDSVVIWPAVDVTKLQKVATKTIKTSTKSGFIIYGRQVSWKRIDLVIEAVLQTGDSLVVIGYGPEHSRLVQLAGDNTNIKFLPKYQGIEEIIEYIQSAKAFIFPSLEPFGISPVESLAVGTPVISLKKGGALDIVETGKNGVFFTEQTVQDIVQAIDRYKKTKFNPKQVSETAKKFSVQSFKKEFETLVDKHLKKVVQSED